MAHDVLLEETLQPAANHSLALDKEVMDVCALRSLGRLRIFTVGLHKIGSEAGILSTDRKIRFEREISFSCSINNVRRGRVASEEVVGWGG
jgi:hypothetical protein